MPRSPTSCGGSRERGAKTGWRIHTATSDRLADPTALANRTGCPILFGMGGYQERAFKSDQEAAAAIRQAVRNSNGSILQAAKSLGISFRSMSRYITRLGLRAELRGESGARAPNLPGLAGSAPSRK